MNKRINRKKKDKKVTIKQTWPYHLLLLPGMLVLVVYTIIPFFGNIMAFQDFKPALGFFRSEWVGLENFRTMFMLPDFGRVVTNTLIIAVCKIVLTMVFSLFFAILLNEITHTKLKKTVQTICFLPHFLSWVILASVFKNLLDSSGLVNQFLVGEGILKEAVNFLGSNKFFKGILIGTDVWKEFGYGAVIFIAALTGINPELYEAAALDGAGRLAKIWHVTLPGIRTTIVMVATLNIANILNAGFDQVYNMISPVVYQSGDVIDTYVYRLSFLSNQYSLATAVGMFKSIISFVLIIISNWAAKKFANYRIF